MLQVRASALSGECSLLHEVFRGVAISPALLHGDGMRACVKRRAVKSLRMNPHCTDSDGSAAARAVDAVFDECYADITPFEEDPLQK